MKSENFEQTLDEAVWLIVTLANQAIQIFNLQNHGSEKSFLAVDEVKLLTTPTDFAAFKDAITECMFKGTKRNVESEESKNAVDRQAMMNCLLISYITAWRICI